MITIDDIEVQVKLNQKKSMLAQAQISIGPLIIIGYRIMKSEFEQGLYIQPPSVRAGVRWLWITKFSDPGLWKQLEDKIKAEYLKISTQEVQNLNSTEINPDDIPF